MNSFVRLLAHSVIVLFVYSAIFSTKVQAAGEFRVDYDVAYAISNTGVTTVTQNITLTNLVSQLYAKEYAITVDSDQLKNIVAYDQRGAMRPTISQKNGKTEIRLDFNEPVVGSGKAQKFTLRYDNRDFAQKVGQIWEVNIPGIARDDNLGDYTVTVDVPPGFGKTAYLWPIPKSGNRWTKEQLLSGGITAAFGEKQTFLVSLTYHLDNSAGKNQLTEIALPPDTAFQKVIIDKINPEPLSIYRDSDGNWLARYTLSAGKNLEIVAQLFITITIEPRSAYGETEINPADYLKPQPFWETTDTQIRQLAARLLTPRAIYDYVVTSLNYDYSRVTQNSDRLGAKKVLGNPAAALCQEFTDLFIAIARATGIPARKAVGFAYTTNAKLRPLSLVTDILHAWPEYYDQTRKLWVPIDPTWTDTTGGLNYFDKLDFNHLVFAIQGIASDYPYPAGFYRKATKLTKDVRVEFADPAQAPKTGKITTTLGFPGTVLAGFPLAGNLIIKNLTGTAFENVPITLKVVPFNYTLERREAVLTPFSQINLPVRVKELSGLFNYQRGTIIATVNQETTQTQFTIIPVYLWAAVPLIGLSAIASLVYLLFLRRRVKCNRHEQV